MPVRKYQLGPDEGIPASFEDYLTRAEISEHLRLTASGKAAGRPILAGDVPATNRAFASWSLFLISNPAWLGADAGAKMKALYDSYEKFAVAIGGHHAAVWFGKVWPEQAAAKPREAPLQIDTERCADYAKAYGLDLAASPHVVVTTRPPSLADPADDYVVLSLNGLKPDSVTALLTRLADQLVHDRLDEAQLHSQAWWLKWKDAAIAVLGAATEVARRVTVRIKAGVVDVTIPGDKAPPAKKD